MSNIGYSIREALRHFRRNWSTVFGAIVTIFLSLFIIGVFVLGSAMITNLVGNVEDRVTIQAFLSDDAEQAAVDALKAKVEGWDNVESVRYKSKDEALQEYKETMSNRNAADAVAALDGENPVPASLVIKLDDPQQVEAVANKLIADADFAAVADDPDDVSASVQYGRETVERLFSVTNYIRIGALVLVGLLTFVAFVFINNTIRLAISGASSRDCHRASGGRLQQLHPRALRGRGRSRGPASARCLPSPPCTLAWASWSRASRTACSSSRSRCRSASCWRPTPAWSWVACCWAPLARASP